MHGTPRAFAILLVALLVGACSGGEGPDRDRSRSPGGEAAEVDVDSELGTLKVDNRVDEPIAIHLDGRELYVVPPGRSYTFRNLPTREVDIYGVGRVSERHYGLPVLTIEEGGEYEWTINP